MLRTRHSQSQALTRIPREGIGPHPATAQSLAAQLINLFALRRQQQRPDPKGRGKYRFSFQRSPSSFGPVGENYEVASTFFGVALFMKL